MTQRSFPLLRIALVLVAVMIAVVIEEMIRRPGSMSDVPAQIASWIIGIGMWSLLAVAATAYRRRSRRR